MIHTVTRHPVRALDVARPDAGRKPGDGVVRPFHRSGEFGDLYENGIVDPVRVTRLSLEHAASVAALLLIAQPGAVIAPGFGDLAEGLARPSSPI